MRGLHRGLPSPWHHDPLACLMAHACMQSLEASASAYHHGASEYGVPPLEATGSYTWHLATPHRHLATAHRHLATAHRHLATAHRHPPARLPSLTLRRSRLLWCQSLPQRPILLLLLQPQAQPLSDKSWCPWTCRPRTRWMLWAVPLAPPSPCSSQARSSHVQA